MARSKEELDAAAADAESWLDHLDPDDPTLVVDRDLATLRSIGSALSVLEAAEAGLVRAVAEAKRAGKSWTDIAIVLGVSRQAARQRFGSKIDASWPQVDVEVEANGRSAAEAS